MGQRVGYVGESLQALVSEATFEALHTVEREIVEQARVTMYDAARAATPARTGAVRHSWLPQPIWPHGPDRWEARVTNDHWLANILNYGSEAHIIRPRRKRALTEQIGPRADAHVSGVQPHHMAEHAIEAVRYTINETTFVAQERFKRDAEFAIQRRKRTHLP